MHGTAEKTRNRTCVHALVFAGEYVSIGRVLIYKRFKYARKKIPAMRSLKSLSASENTRTHKHTPVENASSRLPQTIDSTQIIRMLCMHAPRTKRKSILRVNNAHIQPDTVRFGLVTGHLLHRDRPHNQTTTTKTVPTASQPIIHFAHRCANSATMALYRRLSSAHL